MPFTRTANAPSARWTAWIAQRMEAKSEQEQFTKEKGDQVNLQVNFKIVKLVAVNPFHAPT